jgi:hypothetical protein
MSSRVAGGIRITLFAAARALRPQVRACADQIEYDRRLPQSLVDAIAADGLFKMLVPKTLGGSDVSPETFVRVIAEVAREDAITAWCIFLPACDGIAAESLRPEVAWDIFGREPQAYVAASNAPSRRAMLGCKSFTAAQDTRVGIARMHMIKKRQLVAEEADKGRTAAALCYALAASSPAPTGIPAPARPPEQNLRQNRPGPCASTVPPSLALS